MTPQVLLALLLCLVGTLGSGLFSGAETAAYRFNRTRHRLRLAEGSRRALLVQSLTADLPGFLVVCLVGTNLCNSLVSTAATLAVGRSTSLPPELVSTLTVAPALFILGELAPKELFRRHADRMLYAAAPALKLSSVLFWPVVRGLGFIHRALEALGLNGQDDSFGREERLRQAIAAGLEGGTLTAYQGTVARNIFSLRMRRVRHAMVPFARVDVLEDNLDLPAARARARATPRGRYPLLRASDGFALGVIDLYDLVFEDRPGACLRDYLRPAPVLRPDERVAEALLRLRRERAPLALVGDPRRPLGIVTLKDLVEEITGELQDL